MWFPSCIFFSSRRRHTRFDCDWSSDVCSSDLVRRHQARARLAVGQHAVQHVLDFAALRRRERHPEVPALRLAGGQTRDPRGAGGPLGDRPVGSDRCHPDVEAVEQRFGIHSAVLRLPKKKAPDRPDRGRNGAKVVETANVVTAGYQEGCATFRGQDEARPQHVTRVTHVRTQRPTDVPYIGSRNLYPRGSMPRTLLAGLALIALAACGGGSHHGRARAPARAPTPLAPKATATKAGAPAKRKGAAKPDTAGQRNPLVNH